MINELYEMFPNEIVFKILSFQPHQTADMIRGYWLWRRLHNMGMFRIRQDIDRIFAHMVDVEQDTGIPFGFYEWYMYNEVWQMFDNIERASGRIGDWYS